MGNESSVPKVYVKVYVDESKKKVMFAEAQEDFVDILLSFFTLPLGKIAKILRKHEDSKDIKVGSLSSLYESVANLNYKDFRERFYKDTLLNPTNSSAHVCSKLKVNLDQTLSNVDCFQGAVFLKKKAKFIVTDDLKVVPIVLENIQLLNSLGVENIDLLNERTMSFGFEEFLNLLKWSLLTNNPLTTMVLGGSNPCSSFFTNSALKINQTLISSNSSKTLILKLLVQKSKKKVLCAQVENRFVELLLSFLTIPLGTYIRLTKDDSSPLGITNLYDSISCLDDGKLLKSEDMKSILLCPKLSSSFRRVTDLLPIYEVNTTNPGCFLREGPTFIVTDDLKVRISPSIATISKFNKPGDTELLDFSIGEQEALFLLNASLKSTSALTECLMAFRKTQKDHESDFAFIEDGGTDSEEDDFTSVEENDKDTSFEIVD